MISSHLTPEPERRLWLILENVRHQLDSAERRAAALGAFAAAQFAFIKLFAAPGSLTLASLLLSSAALLLALAAFFPLSRLPKWLAPGGGLDRQDPDDCMIYFKDIVKYSHGELILRLDKYLGGGITGTLYYEDIISRILADSRVASRRLLLLRAGCAAAVLAQLCLTIAALRALSSS